MLISELVATGWSGWFACRLRLQNLNQKWAKSDLEAVYIFRDENATRGHHVMMISWIRRLFWCYSEAIPRLQSETWELEFQTETLWIHLNFSFDVTSPLLRVYTPLDKNVFRYGSWRGHLPPFSTLSASRPVVKEQ